MCFRSCCRKSAETKSLLSSEDQEKATPLPRAQIFVLVFCFLADTLTVNVALPMSPFMVQHFFQFPASEQHKIGYYSGLIAGSYTLGQILTGSYWGSLSDRVGRRPIILVGLATNIICMTAFGLAESFEVALLFRFLQGALSGNIVVARSYLSDITDSTNEAQGFALIGACFGIGGVLGPWMGGWLCFPADKFPATFSVSGVFGARPFLLPCLTLAAIAFVDFLCAFWLLPESKRLSERQRPERTNRSSSDIHQILRIKNFRSACLTFALFGICFFAFMEVFPIWARNPAWLGGPGFSSASVGTLQGAVSSGTLIASLLVYPRLAGKLGFPAMFRLGLLLNLLAVPWPAVVTAAGWQIHPNDVWWLLAFTNAANSAGAEFCFTTGNLLLKNSVPEHLTGTALGLGNSCVCTGIAVGPMLGASFFAVSLALPSGPAVSAGLALINQGKLLFWTLVLLMFANFFLHSTLFGKANKVANQAEEAEAVKLDDYSSI